MAEIITALPIKNAPSGPLRIETGLRYRSYGNGTGEWQGRYTVAGKTRGMTLGKFPEMSLREARDRNQEIRSDLKSGRNPLAERDAELAAAEAAQDVLTFEKVARLAYDDLKHTWKSGGARNGWLPKMEKFAFPEIGDRPASEVTGRVLADLVRPMWHDRHPTANKILIHCSQVLGWAEASEYDCDGFAVKRARKILGKTRYRTTNHKAMDYEALPAFYATLGNTMQDLGLRFYILTLPRTANVTQATWGQIQGQEWHLPADAMKREAEHVVPLVPAAMAILDEAGKIKANQSREGYIFKNDRAWNTGHISSNGWTQQMRRHKLGATAHGMRSSFKMWATLNRIDSDTIIEEVLHHKVRGAVESAYLRGHMAELRRPIMEKWADFVTGVGSD